MCGLGLAGLLAATAALSPVAALGGAAAAAVVAVVFVRPVVGTYLVMAVTPLIVGIDRGSVIPVVRPSEAVLLLVEGAVVARWFLLAPARSWRLRLRLSRLDLSILLLAVCASVLPLLWMLARGLTPVRDDLLYTFTLWKYAGLYWLVRATVKTERQVATCLLLSVSVAVVVALVGILQALNLGGVPDLLARFYAPFDDPGLLKLNRASSTIAQPQGFADFVVFNLAIALAWLPRVRRIRPVAPVWLLSGASVLFFFAALASGQFSGFIGLAVGVVVIAAVTPAVRRRAPAFVPLAALGAVALRPVLSRRLAGFEGGAIPVSWEGRLENLRTYFWPPLHRWSNFLLGVRPLPRVPGPSRSGRPFIFIESGHTWLLWTGGVPLFLAFFWFMAQAWRVARAAARLPGAVGVAGTSALAAVVVVFVLTLFDPHLTLRGTADLFFPLLALSLVRESAEPAA